MISLRVLASFTFVVLHSPYAFSLDYYWLACDVWASVLVQCLFGSVLVLDSDQCLGWTLGAFALSHQCLFILLLAALLSLVGSFICLFLWAFVATCVVPVRSLILLALILVLSVGCSLNGTSCREFVACSYQPNICCVTFKVAISHCSSRAVCVQKKMKIQHALGQRPGDVFFVLFVNPCPVAA